MNYQSIGLMAFSYALCCSAVMADFLTFESSDRTLIRIDRETGNAVVIREYDNPVQIVGLDFDGDGTLYASGFLTGSRQLFTLDPTTGVAAVVGDYPLDPDAGVPYTMSAIEFDEQGVLYGMSIVGWNLVTIDPETADVTVIGPTGFVNIQSLAFDDEGQLYGVETITDQLVSIDTATGAATVVGPVGVGFIGGIECDQNGFMVGIESSGNRDLLVVDTDSGATTVVANHGVQFVDSLTLIPPNQLGDVNGDGFVNLLDVPAFVAIVSSGQYQIEADINEDGVVNLLDVGPFVDLFTG